MIELMNRTDESGKPITFSFTYVKLNGELRRYKGATLSSFHASGDTVNIIPANERRPKKFLRILIIEFNNMKVYL